MKKLLIIFFSFLIFFSLASPVFAQAENRLRGNDCLYKSTNVVTLDCVPVLFANIIYWLLILSGTVAVFFVIFGGIKFLTSGGDPKNVEGARKTITWALIGLVVVLLSFGIVAFIAETTGVACIRRFGFNNCGPIGGGSVASEPDEPTCVSQGSLCGGSTTCCNPYECRNVAPASQMPDYRCAP